MNNPQKLTEFFEDLASQIFTCGSDDNIAHLAPISLMFSMPRVEIGCHPIGDSNFNKPHQNALHYHDFIELFWLHSLPDKLGITIGDHNSELKHGHIVALPMRMQHRLGQSLNQKLGYKIDFTLEVLKNHVGNKALELFFDFAYIRPWVNGGNANAFILSVPEDSRFALNQLVKEIEAASNRAGAEQLKRNSNILEKYNKELVEFLCEFSARFSPIFYSSCTKRELKVFEKYRPPMLAVLDYIDTHLTEQIKLADICELVGLGTSRFSILFRDIMKFSLIEYINFIRLRKSRYLLSNTNLKITEVSELCGFNSPIYFERIFKAQTGCSPKAYRTEYILEWQ